MGGNSYYTYITIKELVFIHAYVTEEEILTSQALQFLEQFDLGTIRQTRRYRLGNNGEGLFTYYRQKYPKLLKKQKLYTYEELKHRAVYYCSSHLTIHM
ncbi:hypothetical protein [Bacillus sp. C30]|uniref:hypothetical protein n=1 Tax=Bacillus sp. C30 TaxID=1387733 RepID=UPI00349F3B04